MCMRAFVPIKILSRNTLFNEEIDLVVINTLCRFKWSRTELIPVSEISIHCQSQRLYV